MNNKKLELTLNKLKSEKKYIPIRDKVTTSVDSEMWRDFKDLCIALNKPINVGLESMLYIIINNEEFLTVFLNEIDKR